MIGPDCYAFRALWRQYRNCRRNKRTTANALAFELNAEGNLLALQEELRGGGNERALAQRDGQVDRGEREEIRTSGGHRPINR